jgi:uncharacterized protein YdeI (YjbR/CyaY-like superfamily)
MTDNQKKNPQIDLYIQQGCGRCPLYRTPDCKTLSWTNELRALRKILLSTELTEELKWSVPTYTIDGKNILIMAAFKEYAAISFFKGSLMKDPKGILVSQGKNAQAARLIKVTNLQEIEDLESIILHYISEAIEIEKSGLQVPRRKTSEFEVPDELITKFEEDPTFEAAFNALTPGRQRGYLIFFAQAKQSQTRISRIEKSMEKIFEGKGWNDR